MQSLNTVRPPPVSGPATIASVRVLVVVEGRNDVEFLRRISRVLHRHDPDLLDLATMEERGALVFMPIGGGGIAASANRFSPLGLPEFHLYDRELPPETQVRCEAIKQVNRRLRCRAVLTRKRSLENYLHPRAIRLADGVRVRFGDFDAPPDLVARANHRRTSSSLSWETLPYRTRKRLANRAKRWLNTSVVDHMAPELIAASDPDGEVVSWLDTIRCMAGAGR